MTSGASNATVPTNPPDADNVASPAASLLNPKSDKVDVLGVALLRDERVRRVDIAVHQPELVRGVERRPQLSDQRQRARRLQRPLATQ